MNVIAQAPASPANGPKLDNRRVLAGVVDLAVLGAGAAALSVAVSATGEGALSPNPQLGLLFVAWALFYYFALESGDGQTLGKKLLKLRVVRADGRPAGMREVGVRTVLRVVDGVGAYLVGLVVMMVTGTRRQRLGDLAAGTIVVSAESPGKAQTTTARSSAATPGDAQESAPLSASSAPVSEASLPVTRPDSEAVAGEGSPLAEDELLALEEEPSEQDGSPTEFENAPAEASDDPEELSGQPAGDEREPVVEFAGPPAPPEREPVVEFAGPPAPPEREPVVEFAGPPAPPEREPVVEFAGPPAPPEDDPVVELAGPPAPAVVPVVDSVRPATGGQVPISTAPPPELEEEPLAEAATHVRPIETVSAMDLVMMDDGPEDEPPPAPKAA